MDLDVRETTAYRAHVLAEAGEVAVRPLPPRRAVEALFKVTVTDVNTMTYRGKRKRERTAKYGRRTHWKRAVVTLKEGEKIETA